jgi:hypothetical protein
MERIASGGRMRPLRFKAPGTGPKATGTDACGLFFIPPSDAIRFGWLRRYVLTSLVHS